jgi:hypothetical protein
MAKQGCTDTDKGLANIFKEIEKFKSLCVKVGVTEEVGSQKPDGSDATLAEYATYNELGTDDGRIPQRPFVRGWVDNNREQIGKTIEKLYGLVSDGKLDAMTAIEQLGEYGESGVGSYIKNGSFKPNSDITINGSKPDKNGNKFIKGKGSSKPLIDTDTMRNSIRYQIIQKSVAMVSEA